MSDVQRSSPRRILRDPDVQARTRLSRVQRWRRVRAGTFPAPVQLGPNSIGWYEDEVEAWLAARPRVSYAAPAPRDAEAEEARKAERARAKDAEAKEARAAEPTVA